MGREVLIAALCCLAVACTLAEQVATQKVKDSESAASAPRLYRDVSVGVYASAAPHGAYSFQIPNFARIQSAASGLIPVKEETTIIQNTNGVLKDSYGNRFVETPQNVAFKTTFPQQFVQLQDLPLHLSQPLSAASPSFEFKPTQFVIGPHYKLPYQAAPARYGVPQPVRFSENLKSYAPPQGFGVPQSLIPAENSASAHGHVTHATQQSAAPSQNFARINFAGPYNYGSPYNFGPSSSFAGQLHPKAEKQSTSNKATYANAHVQQQYENSKSKPKFQRLEAPPKESQTSYRQNAKIQEAPTKHSIATVVNGKKTIVNVETKPSVPLLDISLLEPLTFKNPLVPQVQHFLPRIHQATYHKLPTLDEAKNYQKEFMIKKTKSYDSGNIKVKAQKDIPQKKPQPTNQEELIPHQHNTPQRPALDDSPEIVYEIDMPGHKETYKEQSLSYNKETQSEPVHYTYGSKTKNEPMTYSYAHRSKEPLQVQQTHYQGSGKGPTHLIYHFKPEEQQIENKKTVPQQSEDSGESEESERERPKYQSAEQHNSHPREGSRNYHHSTQQENQHHNDGDSHPQYYNENNQKQRHEELKNPDDSQGHYKPNQAHHETVQKTSGYYPQALQVRPVTTAEYHPLNQYEEEIQFLPPGKSESIKVDPNQHIQKLPHPEGPSPTPSDDSRSSPEPRDEEFNPVHLPAHSNGPPQLIQEKTKRIIIQEETPEEMHSLTERLNAEMIEEEDNNEEDFEKAYKNAAVGFPAYEREATDHEKDIYNPASYATPQEHSSYNIDHKPFQQYQREGDEFPKEARLHYKDASDNMKEDYFLDYSVNKPTSLTDRYTKKADYYKLYKQQRPENLFVYNEDEKKEKSEKYSAYPAKEKKPKEQYFAKFKAPSKPYEYYTKEQPKDNSAHDSRPFQSLRSKTLFVEPQFQYGFEPVEIPRLVLDSELAAMASNDSPESEKPGMRKKMYQENWYIKKTRTLGGDVDS